jgi:hypothetical protein
MASLLNPGPAKKALQTYTIEHGIESITVLVPVKQVTTFEQSFSKLESKTKKSIIALVEELGGKVRS